MGHDEAEAAANVVKSGVLSDFVGADNEFFYGGPKVKELENYVVKNLMLGLCFCKFLDIWVNLRIGRYWYCTW